MIVLVCGDRNFSNSAIVKYMIMSINYGWSYPNKGRCIDLIIEGGADGADKLGRKAGEYFGIPVKTVKANWEKYGKAAGPIRNQEMLDNHKPDIVLAFHSDIEKSKGTKDMLKRAKKAGLTTILVS